MADNLVDEEDLDVILDCLDDDQDIQDAFLTTAEEVCFLFTTKGKVYCGFSHFVVWPLGHSGD